MSDEWKDRIETWPAAQKIWTDLCDFYNGKASCPNCKGTKIIKDKYGDFDCPICEDTP